jgi:hypothetical protein
LSRYQQKGVLVSFTPVLSGFRRRRRRKEEGAEAEAEEEVEQLCWRRRGCVALDSVGLWK